MKTVKLECVTQDQLRNAVAELVVIEGGQGKAAIKMGIRQSNISQLMNGHQTTASKIAAFFGLEYRRVYVPKSKEVKSDE